jgi:hypothetical protein
MLSAAAAAFIAAGCMRYLTHDRSEALLDGVDISATLDVAEAELAQGGRGMSLTLWAIRDQEISQRQARRISELYFAYIDSVAGNFDRWHFTWAIANMYRLGSIQVRNALQEAYVDASKRAKDTHGLADRHANGEKLYMGDAHIGGRRFAQKHVVVPGNDDYLQSFEEYAGKTDED